MYLKLGRFEVGKKPVAEIDDAVIGRLEKQIIDEYEKKSTSSTWNKLFIYGQSLTLGDKAVQFPMKEVASVFKAITAICDNIPQAGFAFFTRSGEEAKDSTTTGTLADRMARPNAKQSWGDFLQEWSGFYALYGEAFVRMIRTIGSETGRGLPEFVNLSPAKMREQIDRETGAITAWKWTGGAISEDIPTEDIIHTKSFNPYNPMRGLSPLDAIAEEVEIDQASLEFNRAFFKNDATPNFILSTDATLTKDQIERLTEWWKSRYGGRKNAFKPAVFEKGLKPSTISNSHKDMDFVEQKRMTREEILGIWKTPKALFNITDDLNYSTFQGQMKIFWLYCLMPILRKFEDSFNAFVMTKYGGGLVFKFDLKNVPAFQEDFAAKVTTAKTLWDMGFTANEINEKLDLGFDKRDWREEWWIGFGQMPASEALKQGFEEPSPSPAGEGGGGNASGNSEQISEEEQEGAKQAGLPAIPKRSVFQAGILKGFGRRQNVLEKAFERKMNRYLYELRGRVLATPSEELGKGTLALDWEKQDDRLAKYTKPMIEESINQGIDIGRSALAGRKGVDDGARVKSIADDLLRQAASSYLAIRSDKIKIVNETLKNAIQARIKRTLQTSVSEGDAGQMSAERILELGEEVRAELRNFFNDAGWRAKLIARTETCGAINGGSHLYYENQGVERKEWLTAGDEFVRETHRACESQGAIALDKKFSNGLLFPADMANGAVGEVVNCRCTLAPVIEP